MKVATSTALVQGSPKVSWRPGTNLLNLLIGAACVLACACPRASGQGYTTVASFNNNGNGSVNPNGNLIMDASGNLFGTTFYGGATNQGSIFEFSPATNTLATVASFSSGLGGANPNGGLAPDGQGNYLGVTAVGGAFGFGSIYQFTPATGQVSAIASFPSSQQTPNGRVTLDNAGNLYVTSLTGGTVGGGALVEVPHISGSMYGVPQTLVSFVGTNGDYPNGGVITDGKGNFYGTTDGGGGPMNGTAEGSLYKFSNSPPSPIFTTVAVFGAGYNPGHNPENALLADSVGNLFGTTIDTVFKFDTATGSLTTLANIFDLGDSTGILTADAGQILYGTTNATVFKLDGVTHAITVFANFPPGTFGYPWPTGGVLLDGRGQLYGTAVSGGVTGEGSIFEVDIPEPAALWLSVVALCVAARRIRTRIPPADQAMTRVIG